MTDTDDDYIEETSYVIMDLSSDLTEETIRTLAEERGGMALTDLTETPIYAQLGKQTFCGELDDPVGSYLLFELEEKTTDTGLLPMLSSMRQSNNGQDKEKSTKWHTKYRLQVDKVIKANQVEISLKTTTDEMDIDIDNNTEQPQQSSSSTSVH